MSKHASIACYHCSSSILPGELIEAELAGIKRPFCCAGCMAIAQTIHGEGLEVFIRDALNQAKSPQRILLVMKFRII